MDAFTRNCVIAPGQKRLPPPDVMRRAGGMGRKDRLGQRRSRSLGPPGTRAAEAESSRWPHNAEFRDLTRHLQPFPGDMPSEPAAYQMGEIRLPQEPWVNAAPLPADPPLPTDRGWDAEAEVVAEDDLAGLIAAIRRIDGERERGGGIPSGQVQPPGYQPTRGSLQEEQYRQRLRQSYPGATPSPPGENQAHPQAGSGGVAGCRLRDLCYEDKAKVAKLIKQAVSHGQEKERLEAALQETKHLAEVRVSKLKNQNQEIINEIASLRCKLTNAFSLLRKYQQKVRELSGEADLDSMLLAAVEGQETAVDAVLSRLRPADSTRSADAALHSDAAGRTQTSPLPPPAGPAAPGSAEASLADHWQTHAQDSGHIRESNNLATATTGRDEGGGGRGGGDGGWGEWQLSSAPEGQTSGAAASGLRAQLSTSKGKEGGDGGGAPPREAGGAPPDGAPTPHGGTGARHHQQQQQRWGLRSVLEQGRMAEDSPDPACAAVVPAGGSPESGEDSSLLFGQCASSPSHSPEGTRLGQGQALRFDPNVGDAGAFVIVQAEEAGAQAGSRTSSDSETTHVLRFDPSIGNAGAFLVVRGGRGTEPPLVMASVEAGAHPCTAMPPPGPGSTDASGTEASSVASAPGTRELQRESAPPRASRAANLTAADVAQQLVQQQGEPSRLGQAGGGQVASSLSEASSRSEDDMNCIMEQFTRTLSVEKPRNTKGRMTDDKFRSSSPESTTGQGAPLDAALWEGDTSLRSSRCSAKPRGEGGGRAPAILDAGHSGGRRSRRSNRGYTRYRDDNSSWEGDLSLSGTTSLNASYRHTPRSQRGALVPRGTPGYPPEQTFDHDLVNLVDELDAGDQSPSVGEAAGWEMGGIVRDEALSQRGSFNGSPDSQVNTVGNWKEWGRRIQAVVADHLDDNVMDNVSTSTSQRSERSARPKLPGWMPRADNDVQENDWVSGVLKAEGLSR